MTYQVDDVGIWRHHARQVTGIYSAGQVGQSFDVTGPASLTIKAQAATSNSYPGALSVGDNLEFG